MSNQKTQKFSTPRKISRKCTYLKNFVEKLPSSEF